MNAARSVTLFGTSSLLRFVLGSWLWACASLVSAQTIDAPTALRDDLGVVTLRCTSTDVVIRYSIDGSDPGPKGGPYLAPLDWAQGGRIKARAYSADRKQSSELFEMKYDSLPNIKPQPATLVPCTQDRDWPTYDWAKRHAAVTVLLREKKSELVFIGDSITQMFGGEPADRGQPGKAVWEKYYSRRNAGNLGFGYDYIENTLWRLRHGELDGAAAKVVVIHLGTNNVGKNSVEDIVTGLRAIVAEVRQRQPQAQILLMGILPRGPKPDATRTKQAEINTQLATWHGRDNVTFLDITAKYLQPDGSIPRELMSDYLHPTDKGYEIWAEAIEPQLKKWLGE